jgi:hypothetical protein
VSKVEEMVVLAGKFFGVGIEGILVCLLACERTFLDEIQLF